LRLFSFGGYGLALAALALVVFGAIQCPHINPLPSSNAVRKHKHLFQSFFFVQYCRNSKKYHSSGNPKFYKLGIFQSLKVRNLMGKILRIPLKLNFTPNTLACYGF